MHRATARGRVSAWLHAMALALPLLLARPLPFAGLPSHAPKAAYKAPGGLPLPALAPGGLPALGAALGAVRAYTGLPHALLGPASVRQVQRGCTCAALGPALGAVMAALQGPRGLLGPWLPLGPAPALGPALGLVRAAGGCPALPYYMAPLKAALAGACPCNPCAQPCNPATLPLPATLARVALGCARLRRNSAAATNGKTGCECVQRKHGCPGCRAAFSKTSRLGSLLYRHVTTRFQTTKGK